MVLLNHHHHTLNLTNDDSLNNVNNGDRYVACVESGKCVGMITDRVSVSLSVTCQTCDVVERMTFSSNKENVII
jgi:hypothetical protein